METKDVTINIGNYLREGKINMEIKMREPNLIVGMDLEYSEAMNIATELLARCPFELLDKLGDDLAERATKIAMEQQ